MKFMKGLEPLSLLALRVAFGVIFLVHGYPKLVHPNEGMREFFVSHGMPGYFLGVAGIIECFGALLLFTGLFTRPAALLLTVEMGVAIWKVHSTHGILSVKDVLATVGAGLLSVDHLVFGENGKKRRRANSSKD